MKVNEQRREASSRESWVAFSFACVFPLWIILNRRETTYSLHIDERRLLVICVGCYVPQR